MSWLWSDWFALAVVVALWTSVLWLVGWNVRRLARFIVCAVPVLLARHLGKSASAEEAEVRAIMAYADERAARIVGRRKGA